MAIRLPIPARTTVVLIGNGSGAHGLTRMRMVMFFQAALILRPLLKSTNWGPSYYCLTALATDFLGFLLGVHKLYRCGGAGDYHCKSIWLKPADRRCSTVTETCEHIMSENWDHLGGKEVRDGQTTQFSANWERGASSIDSSTLSSRLKLTRLSDAEPWRHLQRYLVMVPNILRMSL